MKRCNTLIALIFLTVIFILPGTTLGLRRFSVPEDSSSIRDTLTAFTDQLFFKKQLIALNIKATSVLTGDSFGGDLSEIAEPYYRQVYYVHFKSFRIDDMASYQSDLVIWECVERYMDDLKDKRLMEQ